MLNDRSNWPVRNAVPKSITNFMKKMTYWLQPEVTGLNKAQIDSEKG